MMSAKIELKCQIYSAVHYLLKSTGADFRGNGKLKFSTESLILQNKNANENLKSFVVFGKKSHLNFAISITANTEVDGRKNRDEISIIFSWTLCAEIERADFRGNGKLNFSTESLIFQNKNAIGNLKRDMLVVF